MDEETTDEERSLEDRAETQYGLFTLNQALASGLNRTTVYRRTRLGRYVLEHPGVFAFAGLPAFWERSVLAGCLAAGQEAVASHRSAARLWGLIDPSEDIVEITVPYAQRPRLRGVSVHRSTDLRLEQTTVRRRIPVTNPLRTMVDLAAVLPSQAVEDALDTGLRWPSLFSVRAVEATLHELAGKGRSGTGVLKTILDERVFGDAVCTPAGLFLAEVDFAYPELKLAIEVDGFGAHGTPRAMAKDFVRQNGLVPFGWRVMRFTWRQVTRQPEMVAAAIRAALVSLQAA